MNDLSISPVGISPPRIQLLNRHAMLNAASFGRALLITALTSLLILRVFITNGRTQHFIYLADAFAHSSTAVDNLPAGVQDKVVFNGHIYVPLGPLPGILLMPVALLFGTNFDEYWASLAFTVVNILLLNRVLAQLGIGDVARRHRLLALFFFGTTYFSVLAQGNSWFLSHILTITFLLLAINESLGARRNVLVGVWLGAAFLTRVTALFALPFFVYLMWREYTQITLDKRRLAWMNLAGLAVGFAPALAFFLWYNFARFGSPFETGYAHAVVGSPALAEALRIGLFSPAHIPKNLYALFLAMPQPVPGWDAPTLQFPYIMPSGWGLSIFFTTPIFLYAFRASLRNVRVIAAWLAVVSILIPLLLYYGIGWRQFGYRYALDFYPFLVVPTALALNDHFTSFARALIVVCIVINLWGAFLSMIGLFV